MNTARPQTNRSILNMGIFLLIITVLILLNRHSSPEYNIKEVTLPEAKALYDSGALVIDVRSEDAYIKRHILGAISIPLSVLERSIPLSIADAKAKTIEVYCGDGVTVGPEGTHILNQAGYKNAVNIKGGFSGWEKAGFPIEKK